MKLEHPEIIPLGKNHYQLARDFVYEWSKDGEKHRLTVPKGFVCDLASVPRILWFLISPFDLGAASIHHDYIYKTSGKIPFGNHIIFLNGTWVNVSERWSRKDADRLFCRMMRESGVSKFKRRSAFYAVRLFGWRAFKKK